VTIGVIGAGNVGGTLGRRWAQEGHQVVFGVREPTEEKVRRRLASAHAGKFSRNMGSQRRAALLSDLQITSRIMLTRWATPVYRERRLCTHVG
jgi:8-hydroxy-5-deazaflavin:NADPH oxidoreductase